MWVTWASVWLQVPNHHPQRQHLKAVRVQVVWAIEADCEIDQRPIEWILVTSLPVHDFEHAQQLLCWYSYRWIIERYHYTLKSGCRIEHLQLETLDRLERAIACYAIVAWRLLWLTYLVRPLNDPRFDIGAAWVLEDEEWQALSQYYGIPLENEELAGLQQCVRWIAILGGFLGRKSDGEPGARTIWRGLRRLRDLTRLPTAPPVIASG